MSKNIPTQDQLPSKTPNGFVNFFRKDANRWIKIMLIVSLSMIIVGSMFSSLFLTDFGNVVVTNVNFPMANGQFLAGDLYRPTSATEEHKAPLVIVVPGFQRTKETQIGPAMELARRGFVVICFDPYNQGDSSSTSSSQSATTEGYGLFQLVEYIYNGDVLNYIDKTKISATGHSAGGNACIRAATYFSNKAKADGSDNMLHSIYISGYIETITANWAQGVYNINMGMGYALYDEGAYRAVHANGDYVQNATTGAWSIVAGDVSYNQRMGYRDGDMRYAAESKRFVYATEANPDVADVEIGKIYGNPNDKNMRVVFNEETLHALQPYDVTANAHIAEFFETSLGFYSGMSTYNQTWMFKEFFGLISLVGAMLLVVPLGALLLKLPIFSSINNPVPQPIGKRTKVDSIVFWSTTALGALIAGLTFIPFCNMSLTIFPQASASQQTWFFPQRMNNAVLIWAVLNGLIGTAIFLITHFVTGAVKKKKLSREHWGIKTSFVDIVKTILLAITIYGAVIFLVNTMYYLFHVDFRFMFFAIQPFQKVFIPVLAMYVPFFAIFYLSNSLRVNASFRMQDVAPWKACLKAGLANCAGLIIVLAIQYIVYAATGTVAFNKNADGVQLWLYVNMLFTLAPMMFILPYFNYYFFKISGRMYLGPIVTCLIFVTMSLTSSVMYYPLP